MVKDALANNPMDIDDRDEIRTRLRQGGVDVEPLDTKGEVINHWGFRNGVADNPRQSRGGRTDRQLAADVERTMDAAMDMGVDRDDPVTIDDYEPDWYDGDDL